MIQIAIMGLGTVGTGVAKVVEENARQIERKLGEPLQVKTILVRHFKDGPYRDRMTDDFGRIERDPDIRVVVETIGGVEAAYEYTRRALAAGKHVVTANKQLVAEHGCELLALAREKGVSYLFEASVGGGIPILHPLTECMAVEGIDAGRKTCILADLAFGRQTDPAAVPMEGISRLDLRDVKEAEQAGYRIKLLGRAVRLENGARSAYVSPHLISEDTPLANVEDVFNAVVVRGNATGEVMFYGKGAGALPTASACVADVMEALQSGVRRTPLGWDPDPAGFVDPMELSGRWYVRTADSAARAAEVFGQIRVLSEEDGTVFLTDEMTGRKVAELSAGLQTQACLRVL